MTKVTSLKEAKEKAAKNRYSNMVLAAFDDLDHAERRQQLERKADIQREARNKL